MPTYDVLSEFWADYRRLSLEQRRRFRAARRQMVADLQRGAGFRAGLRIKGVRTHPGVFEMTWAPDGRATFHCGTPVRPGEAHVVWRRIGRHEILDRP